MASTVGLKGSFGTKLDSWLDTAAEHLDLDIEKTDKAFDAVRAAARRDSQTAAAYAAIKTRVPFFVYFLAVLQGPAAHSSRSTRCARSCR